VAASHQENPREIPPHPDYPGEECAAPSWQAILGTLRLCAFIVLGSAVVLDSCSYTKLVQVVMESRVSTWPRDPFCRSTMAPR